MTARPLPPQHQMALRQALALHQGGQVDQARRIYKQILAVQPASPDLLNLLGAAECQLGNTEEGARLLARSVKLAPGQSGAHHNLGNALNDLGRFQAALESFDRAVALRADHAEAWFSRGNALRGLVRSADAIASYERALALEPGYGDAWLNRGHLLLEAKRLSEAAESYARALALESGLAEAWSGQGNVLTLLGRFDEALQSYDRAVAVDPAYAEAWSNRGTALRRLDRLDDAVASYDRALQRLPDYAEALYGKGLTLEAQGRLEDAVAAYDRAVALKPALDSLMGQALHARMQLADWRDFDRRLDALAAGIAKGQKVSAPLPVQALIDDPRLQRQAAEIFARAETPPVTLDPPARHRHDRIRLGYFSSDFRNHPVAHLIASALERHDRTRFEVFAFSLADGPDDDWRRRVRTAADYFIDVSRLPDTDIARLARDKAIDIAIDLNGWTKGYRAGLFAERAAPVQASYLGYLGSMGAPGFDYLLADETLIPTDAQRFYSEAIAYLPSYQVNDGNQTASDKVFARAELGLPEDGFVFCSFNQVYKLTPQVFGTWMRILTRVPKSVLWLYVDNAVAMANLKAEAQKAGVEPDRLRFAERVSLGKHLARQKVADLFLDSHPYNAGATASNALRMGLPVLTRIGQSFPARYGASLLHAVGLPELITDTPEAYEALAIRLATHPEELAALRAKLATNLPTAALFDTEGVTRALEAAFAAMHERAQAGLPPETIRPW